MIVIGCAIMNDMRRVMLSNKNMLETTAMASWIALTAVSLTRVLEFAGLTDVLQHSPRRV